MKPTLSKYMSGAMLVSGLLLLPGLALAQALEFTRGQTTVVVGSNTITADNNVKFVNYTGGPLTVTLNYSATCNIVFGGLTLRLPQSFTPPPTSGTLANVSGTPTASGATAGNVTFQITFDPLKQAGQKSFGVAHLNLVLGVDSDCNPATGDTNGVDETTTIGVQISVSTATHP